MTVCQGQTGQKHKPPFGAERPTYFVAENCRKSDIYEVNRCAPPPILMPTRDPACRNSHLLCRQILLSMRYSRMTMALFRAARSKARQPRKNCMGNFAEKLGYLK